MECEPSDVQAELEKAAARARVLGVCGGDGSVNTAAEFDLSDGRLDIRVVHGGRRPAVRLLAAALAGPLTRSPAHTAVRVSRLRVDGVAPGTLLAYDGEVTEAKDEVTLRKTPGALTVYRPLPLH